MPGSLLRFRYHPNDTSSKRSSQTPFPKEPARPSLTAPCFYGIHSNDQYLKVLCLLIVFLFTDSLPANAMRAGTSHYTPVDFQKVLLLLVHGKHLVIIC